jgi:hypothetical protein
MSAAALEHIERCVKSLETIKNSQLTHQNRYRSVGARHDLHKDCDLMMCLQGITKSIISLSLSSMQASFFSSSPLILGIFFLRSMRF